MAKCIECLGCTRYVWEGGLRYLFCDLCGKYYNIVDGKLVETTPTPLKTRKRVVAEKVEVVEKKEPVIEEEKLPIDKKVYKW